MATLASQEKYVNPNFQVGDSPVTLDLKTDLGAISTRAVALANDGPGGLQLSVSYDEGVTFELEAIIPPTSNILGGVLNDVDQIKIEHVGQDTGYFVIAVASAINPQIVPFPDPEVHFADNYFSEFLLDGVIEDMSVDGTTPVEYLYTVPTDRRIRISQAYLTLEDSNLEFDPVNFGRITGPLTNGVEISITPSGGSKTVLETWVNNREIRSAMFDFDTEFRQDGAYVGRWALNESSGSKGVYLNDGDKFSLLVQDDLTGLDFMSLRIRGITLNIS